MIAVRRNAGKPDFMPGFVTRSCVPADTRHVRRLASGRRLTGPLTA
jgi:hypothetical protein